MNSRENPIDPNLAGLQEGGGLREHRRHIQPNPAILDVVTVISNPVRFRSRYDLYRAFEQYCVTSGARLTTVELAYGNRPFEITEAGNPRHLQLRTGHELWHKENLINLGIETLPRDWQYVAWVDGDVRFARPDWVQETLQQLQHCHLVQMFSHAQDLGPDSEPLRVFNGFCYSYLKGIEPGRNYEFWHPGYAWAARREAISALGGLIDWAILGAGDHHMAKALIGRVWEDIAEGISPVYLMQLDLWQERALKYIQRNIGYVPGLLNHYWHGRKVDRRYWDRWKILVNNEFDPQTDLKRDWQGVLQLTDRSYRLRDDIRAYFRARNEDTIETE